MSEGSQGMGVHAMKGQILNERYRITAELGRGGQARTYKAEDPNTFNQICVVKHLLPAWSVDPTLSDAERSNLWETAQRLFRQEAQALANLGHHPQIPRLLDHFVENQEFYLVQEFIDGQPLSAELPPSQPWSESKVLSLLDEVLAILEFVHSKDVIHRDIKPDNIIRRALDGKLVLVDFGAVKLERQMTEVSSTFRVSSTSQNSKTVSVGTLGYMPSEQQKGKPVFASDLYALGMIGIQALTGKNAADLVLYHEDEESGEINWRPLVTVSDELASFLTQMVRSLPKKRYQSATEARQALPLYRQQKNQTNVYQKTEVAPEGTKTAQSSNPSTQGGKSATNPPPPAKDFRFIRTLTGHAASVGSIAISSDSQTLVSGSDDGTIKLWNLDTGSLIRTFTQQPKFLQHKNTWVTSVAISPQSQVLAGGTLDNTVKLWHLNNGSWIRDLNGHFGSVYTVAISPDGQNLVSAGQEKTIKVWNLSNGQMLRNLRGHSDWVYAVAISPDGQTLVSGGRDNTIKVWNLLNSKLLSTCTGHIDWVRCVTIRPDGKTIASGSNDNTIKLWNLDSGQLIRTLNGHTHRVSSVAISQDGTTLISGSHDKTIKLWDMGNGNLIHTLTGHLESVCCVATSPDGKTIASSSDDGAIKIWQPN